jgi:hypothetical protein
MSNDNLDPLIKREFEALGLNIVSNDLLADMVFERVKKRRIRKWLVAGVVALSILALAGLSYVAKELKFRPIQLQLASAAVNLAI